MFVHIVYVMANYSRGKSPVLGYEFNLLGCPIDRTAARRLDHFHLERSGASNTRASCSRFGGQALEIRVAIIIMHQYSQCADTVHMLTMHGEVVHAKNARKALAVNDFDWAIDPLQVLA
jgi:hypothetical protein